MGGPGSVLLARAAELLGVPQAAIAAGDAGNCGLLDALAAGGGWAAAAAAVGFAGPPTPSTRTVAPVASSLQSCKACWFAPGASSKRLHLLRHNRLRRPPSSQRSASHPCLRRRQTSRRALRLLHHPTSRQPMGLKPVAAAVWMRQQRQSSLHQSRGRLQPTLPALLRPHPRLPHRPLWPPRRTR